MFVNIVSIRVYMCWYRDWQIHDDIVVNSRPWQTTSGQKSDTKDTFVKIQQAKTRRVDRQLLIQKV